jgi:hypothetical protein
MYDERFEMEFDDFAPRPVVSPAAPITSAIACTHEKQTRTARAGLPAQWVVICRGEEIGLIERFRPKKDTTEPWHAYYPIGMQAKHLGAFYGPAGRIQARNKILEAAGLLLS